LRIHVYSFSYVSTGPPADPWGHGGGFVFDCRLLPNPGRDEALAPFTGLDDCVKDFLVAQPAVERFLAPVAQLVDTAVEEYRQRGYEHLTVAFGCTGGRHRSVYCAEWMSRRLREKAYEVTLQHVGLDALSRAVQSDQTA
jgi:RNase adaptor protein for sRNA GlmZ degradation